MEEEKIPAKNITEAWLNNISEGLLLMERLEKSFRSGVDSLKELSDVFLTIINQDLRKEYYKEGSLKVAEMFLSQAEITLTDTQGFISDDIFTKLQKEIKELNRLLYTNNCLYYYGVEFNIRTINCSEVLQFRPEWKEFVFNLINLRQKFVKILSPILFTNLNSSRKNVEI